MKKYKIFVACDTSDVNFVRKIIKDTKIKINYSKVWVAIFYSKNGKNF